MGRVRLENSGEVWNRAVEPSEAPLPGQPGAKQRLVAGLARAVLRVEQQTNRSLSRADLAKRLNVSPASLYAYLNGTTLPRGPVFERLLDELGVSGADRGRLSSLRDDVEVSRRATSAPRARSELAGAASSLRQLPPRAAHFSGQTAELSRLGEIVEAPQGTQTVRIAVIHGMAGVGKSTLATWWAHDVRSRFPDGQLYVDMRGFGVSPPLDADEALLGFLHALGVSMSSVPLTQDAKAGLYRSLLDGRRMLILLDNVRSSEQARPLIPSAPGCAVVVTTRDRLDSLVIREGALRIALDVMSYDEAEGLLAERLTLERLTAEPASVHDLAELCAYLPLALSIVASRAADRPHQALSSLVAELRDTRDVLDHLSSADADLDIQTVFQWSYDVLSPAAARLFRLLGLHPGPDIDLAACDALAGTLDSTRAAVRELVGAHLLTERPVGRFRIHDLLSAYARARGLRDDPGADRTEAVRRLLDHYLGTTSRANARIHPHDVPNHDHEDNRSAGSELGTYAAAMAWFTTEYDTLLRLIDHAAGHGFESYAWKLAWVCMVFLRRTSRHNDRVKVQRTAVAAARRAGDRPAQATSLRLLADALARARQGSETVILLTEALAIVQETGDEQEQLRTHLSFVRTLDAVGDHAQALNHARHALLLAESGPQQLSLADAFAAVGKQLTRLDQTSEASRFCSRALSLYSAAGHTEGEASILKVIGDAELQAGRVEAAILAYQRSVTLDRSLGDRYWEAHGLGRLGVAYRVGGDEQTAARLQAQAVAVLESLHHPDSAVVGGADGP